MAESLVKVKEFCKMLRGRVSERRYPDFGVRVVTCILPDKRDMGVLVTDEFVDLYVARAGGVRFDTGEARVHVSVRRPNHAIFSAGGREYGAHIWGYFNVLEVTYEERANKFNISMWESEKL